MSDWIFVLIMVLSILVAAVVANHSQDGLSRRKSIIFYTAIVIAACAAIAVYATENLF